jgi:hypothetical protein
MSSQDGKSEAYEMIDRMTTIHPRPQKRNVTLQAYEKLYQASRGSNPISFDIAEALVKRNPAKIGMFTGAFSATMPHGENDGPIGAVVLAAALSRLGHTVVFPIEDLIIPGLKRLLSYFKLDCEIIPIPIEGQMDVGKIADTLDVAIAIERGGANTAGILHSGITAKDIRKTRAKVDGFFDRLHDRGKLTLGIGDGGNEIGFGKIFSVAQEVFPYGKICNCPCKQGNIAKTATTLFLPATVSNWGGYAIAAGIAIRAQNPSLALTPEGERDLLKLCADVDIRDGVAGAPSFSVDGIPGECSMAMVQILKTIVDGVV